MCKINITYCKRIFFHLLPGEVYSIDDLESGQGRPASTGKNVKTGKKKRTSRSAVTPEPMEGWTRGNQDYDDDDLL